MTLPESLTKVTRLSKVLAMLLLVALPFLGFWAGVKYQESVLVCQTEDKSIVFKDRKTELDSSPSDWKTFTSDSIGITFQYPPEWVVDHNVNNDQQVTFYPRGYLPTDHDDGPIFSCSHYGMGREIDLAEMNQLPISNLNAVMYYNDSFATVKLRSDLICILDVRNSGDYNIYKSDFEKILFSLRLLR